MGCTVSKRKPTVPAGADGKQPESIKSNKQESSSSKSSASGEGKKKSEADKPSASNKTDISKLVTEGKTSEVSEQKKAELKTLEEKSAKIPSIDKTEIEKKTTEKTGQTPSPFPCATPLKEGEKLKPPKPDNGEYINFNDVLSDDDFSEADEKDGKKKEKKEDGKKEDKKKEAKKEEKKEAKKEEKKEVKKEEKKEAKKEEKKEDKKEKEKEKEKPKEAKPAAAAQPCLTAAPKQEKPKATDLKSARSVGAKGAKKPEATVAPPPAAAAASAPKKADGMKLHETKDAVRKMRTGAVRTRHAPHEDTLYQVPHRMPEVDFTKMH